MYVQEVVQAGPVIETRKYHTSRYSIPSIPRAKNHSKTSAEQWVVNERNSIRNLRLLILENFKKDDIRLDLTYEGEEPSEQEATRRLDNFIKTLRRRYHKDGNDLKWTLTTEGQNHRIHHHLLINNIGWSRADYEALWPWSSIPYKAFHYYDGKPEDAERIAKYFVKETRETFVQKDRCQRVRYRHSRNLRKPKVEKTIIQSKTWREPKPKKGYYIEKPVEYGYTAFGFPYMFYRMVKEDYENQVSHQKKSQRTQRHSKRAREHAVGSTKQMLSGRRDNPLRGSRQQEADRKGVLGAHRKSVRKTARQVPGHEEGGDVS